MFKMYLNVCILDDYGKNLERPIKHDKISIALHGTVQLPLLGQFALPVLFFPLSLKLCFILLLNRKPLVGYQTLSFLCHGNFIYFVF